MNFNRILISSLFVFALVSCKKQPTINPQPITPVSNNFVKGADVSWITEMENAGKKFYTTTGVQKDGMELLKDIGINTIRLRVWVNPTNNWNNTADVVAKATKAKNLGLRILVDFHYSDSWADPGQQTKPLAWNGQNISALQTSLYNHTFSVLNTLKAASITPEWVQIGNETNDGMLWPEGKASTNMVNFAALINSGYDAVKAVNNSIKVIVHISNGNNNTLFRWMFDGLTANNAKYDVIGMSLYPDASSWSTLNTQCFANMNDMVARYNKEVMLVEVGMSWDEPTACQAFLTDIITKTKQVNNNKGLGVIYWEPQCYGNWQGYTKGAFDNNGKPTNALNAFN
jgi:arabinogalactan endo-1,4-beta-galactosidase